MYSLILGGGLGNQMFQYACARNLQIEFGIEFEYNTYNYDIDNTEIEERGFSLNHLRISKPDNIQCTKIAKESNDLYRLCLKQHVIARKLLPASISLKIMEKAGCICTIGDPYSFYPITIRKINGIIHGGFQSEKYFNKNAQVIKQELQVNEVLNNLNQKLANQMLKSESVAVHIRRGDYLDPRYQHLNICDANYYRKSVKYIMDHVNNPTFYIFSNSHTDITWIRNNYTFFPLNTVYVDQNNKDYQELQVMYHCKHFIISNSTFSWWAQYLSLNSNKIVIAPDIWNKSEQKGSNDIYQKNWKLISV